MAEGTFQRSMSISTEQMEELKREVVETRNQMIKTANIVSNLSAEIRDVRRLHQAQRQRLTVNSVASYVIFVLLISMGLYFLYRAQKERLDYEKGVLVREREAAISKLQTLQKSVVKRRDTETRAATFYRLSQSGQIHKALEQYPEIAQLPLSPVESAVFQDWAKRKRKWLTDTSYNNGMKAVADKQWKRAATEFAKAAKYAANSPSEASLRYYYGIALMRLGNYTEAGNQLELSIKAGAEKYVSKEVRFYLATVYEQMGRIPKAKAAYQDFIKRHPHNNFARAARRIIKQLE